jgi:hypothetical protein
MADQRHMRCLYCGKELALLKRWTGGGEFCSDAHRQSYQEEYNKLALNRLLQAKPAESQTASRTDGVADENRKSVELAVPALSPGNAAFSHEDETRLRSSLAEPTLVAAAGSAASAIMAAEATLPAEPEDAGPAEPAGFLMELPVPVMAEVMTLARTDLDLESNASPSLPRGGFEGLETQLFLAGPVESGPFVRILDCAPRPHDRRLEVREFVRSAPVLEIDLDAGTYQMPEIVEEPMEIPIDPHPPQGSPPVWQELWREFEIHTESRALTRVAFRTTGLEDNADNNGHKSLSDIAAEVASFDVTDSGAQSQQQDQPHDPPSAEPNPEIDPAPPPPEPVVAAEKAAVEVAPAEAPENEVAPKIEDSQSASKEDSQSASKEDSQSVSKEDSQSASKPAAPPPSRLSFLRWTASPKPGESGPEKTVTAEPPPKPEPAPAEATPALITKPLPITLHGLAAGRGKSVQVFASPVWARADLQVPRSSGLPLRPVMTLGPAPAAPATPAEAKSPADNKATDKKPAEKKIEERRPDRTVVVKVDPKKGRRPDPRLADKVRKDAAIAESAEPKAPEPLSAKAESASAKVKDGAVADRSIDKTTDKSVDKPIFENPVADNPALPEKAAGPQEKTFGRPGEKSLPAPLAAPYHPPDLGIPSLNIEASGGFWKRLPVAGKAGLVLTLIALVAIVSFVLKSSAGSAATGPTVVEAAPITGAEASWITDWGVEPGVRKAHDISVLRPSLRLTDYRLEFEAQIESKALGWIYRAQDEKNYYVTKLEIVKPGLEPTVALVRYAVIKGEESPRAQFPLSLPLRIDTMYKIRFDALGDHFTTYVQDQKVDEWTDGRLKQGGVGLYSERGERIDLKGTLRVAPLVIKK